MKKVSEKSQSDFTSGSAKIPPKRMARLITAAGSILPFSTCLSNALAGQALFAMHGQKTTLHIGVCKNNEIGFEAHAWLCQDGEILLGQLPDMVRYRELLAISLEERWL